MEKDIHEQGSRTSTPGLLDTDFVYDLRGRLTDVTVGTRTTSFAYDTNGYLDFMTTPDNRTFDYAYDVMGRLTGEARPEGSSVSYSYDNNRSSLKLRPGRRQHDGPAEP